MQIVVNIAEEEYESIKKHPHWHSLGELIANGTILPKGHGKLGDLTKLYNEIDKRNRGKYKGKYTGILALVGFADTIIEADKN